MVVHRVRSHEDLGDKYGPDWITRPHDGISAIAIDKASDTQPFGTLPTRICLRIIPLWEGACTVHAAHRVIKQVSEPKCRLAGSVVNCQPCTSPSLPQKAFGCAVTHQVRYSRIATMHQRRVGSYLTDLSGIGNNSNTAKLAAVIMACTHVYDEGPIQWGGFQGIKLEPTCLWTSRSHRSTLSEYEKDLHAGHPA